MKRMIDNKEFEALKTDVNDLEIKVESVIPTINIEVSQMLTSNTAQLTEEQMTILSNNNYVNIVVPTGQAIPFINSVRTEENTIFNGVVKYDSEMDIYIYDYISVDNSTLVATLDSKVIPKGKQLYKHNVLIYKDGTRYYDYLFIDNMITDSPTQMTYSDIISYLGDNGYVYDSNKSVYRQNEYAMRGWSYDSNNSAYTWYVGVMKASNTEIKTHGMTGDGTINISSGWTIVDTIFTL